MRGKIIHSKYNEERMTIRMAQKAFVVDFIKRIRKKDHGIRGMKLWHMYKRKFNGKSPLGTDRFENVVDRYGLKIRFKVRKPRTTDSTHGLPTYPSLIREFIPTAANQLWGSDIIPEYPSRNTKNRFLLKKIEKRPIHGSL